MKLTVNIAGQYASMCPNKSEDIVAEAVLALTMACGEIANGKMKKDCIKTYIASRVHSRCIRFIRKDRLFGMSHYGLIKKSKRENREITFKQNELDKYDPRLMSRRERMDRLEIKELMERAVVSKRQAQMLKLKMQGYDNNEIAVKLDLSKSLVSKELIDVKKRLRRFLDE